MKLMFASMEILYRIKTNTPLQMELTQMFYGKIIWLL
jgi:hypothetical protein